MSTPRRVCIVTPGYIASTPRVVREADALAEAGFDVRVVFTQGQLEHVRALDDQVVRNRSWRHAAFRWSSTRSDERWAHVRSGVRHRVALALPASAWSLAGVVERAEGRVYPELGDLAAAEAADLYIGHYPAGLAAACRAARRHGALVAYDVEDLYADTFPDTPEWAVARARIITLERRYVPRCAYVSAVSQPVADAFAARYATRAPIVVHNCHPWRERAALNGAILDRRGPALSLYWYSQVVGLDRGLQDAIRAAGRLPDAPQIHFRGTVSADVRESLSRLAGECGVAGSLHFHEQCDPGDLLARAAEHDIGLALEFDQALNRQLAVTNKIFLYLTAGLAVGATDVPGQRVVLEAAPGAGALYPPGNSDALAALLSTWQRDPAALARAKAASLAAARTRWNAELEEAKVVAEVSALLDTNNARRRSLEALVS